MAARLEGRQMVCNAGGTEPVNHKINNITTINNINLIRISKISTNAFKVTVLNFHIQMEISLSILR